MGKSSPLCRESRPRSAAKRCSATSAWYLGATGSAACPLHPSSAQTMEMPDINRSHRRERSVAVQTCSSYLSARMGYNSGRIFSISGTCFGLLWMLKSRIGGALGATGASLPLTEWSCLANDFVLVAVFTRGNLVRSAFSRHIARAQSRMVRCGVDCLSLPRAIVSLQVLGCAGQVLGACCPRHNVRVGYESFPPKGAVSGCSDMFILPNYEDGIQ